jgi:hypothetical protein
MEIDKNGDNELTFSEINHAYKGILPAYQVK